MTAKHTNGAKDAPAAPPMMFALMPNPALQSFAASQRVVLEAARFWARRMHAYADQMETLAHCATPDEFAQAQTQFIHRLRDDYRAESKTLSALIAPEREGEAPKP